jgi:hypothetical protein
VGRELPPLGVPREDYHFFLPGKGSHSFFNAQILLLNLQRRVKPRGDGDVMELAVTRRIFIYEKIKIIRLNHG